MMCRLGAMEHADGYSLAWLLGTKRILSLLPTEQHRIGDNLATNRWRSRDIMVAAPISAWEQAGTA